MKLFVFCLFTACLVSSVISNKIEKRKLKELYHQLLRFNSSLQLSQRKTELPTPPMDIEDCCSLQALDCFKALLHVHFNIPHEHQLIRSLESTLTRRGLTFHGSRRNATSTCKECASHPKESADTFIKSLQSLVQRGISWESDK